MREALSKGHVRCVAPTTHVHHGESAINMSSPFCFSDITHFRIDVCLFLNTHSVRIVLKHHPRYVASIGFTPLHLVLSMSSLCA